ncbi:glycoside hydrolase family 31 protein [Gramella sp. AN32]|uniref:Glycoside hydrolase family 31 protein n=1 Tax=Christiangramia antarctica TaxID=2058158 RepID=A0ABW5X1W5_9FLAO|nr:glycoside hydrolase family 31 protein [Gramella sp. AN32]MCM4156690.1 glycosyl hydrolase [Gramella sp. AN32]
MITNTELEHKGNLYPTALLSYEHDQGKINFITNNGVRLEITVLRDNMLRFRYATTGIFSNDFSYAIDPNQPHGFSQLKVEEEETHVLIHTEKFICKVAKDDLRLGMYELDGTVILEDELGFHWEESFHFGGNFVKMSKSSQDQENFFGLGDKPTNFNLKGKRISNWNTDQYAFGKDTAELYKTVPFYIGLHSNIAYGVFFDNTFKTHFDFCHERRNVTSFWADGGEMNYYFIYGPQMADVVTTYTDLTGKPELPPMWALGFHQCKWSYYPESKVKEITAKFRELQFPCDAIYLDIDYMEGFRCFTWNKEFFPDPKRMVAELEADGFKTVAIIDPGIKIDLNYDVFKEALENDYFCRRADGPYMRGKVWPGECYFPDFTNPEVRDWWKDLYRELIGDIGVKGVWNDMNEPAVMEVPGKTFPFDVRHDYDGNPCSHRKAHNIYGMQMARATYEGVKKYNFPKRPFIITRANYSGGQRYTSTWTGDNVATWEHLWLANVQIQRLCISGMSFAGTDIGGFAEQPSGELYTRWVQMGVFHPFCRVHSSGDHGEQEPWFFGDEVLGITKKFVELRYQLLPYLYTAFYRYIQEGIPFLKPLVYFDQNDVQTHHRSDEFIVGNHILVCPIQEPNVQGRRVYIPKGTWYNYWTKKPVVGGKEMFVEAPLETMPLFIKEGAVIPNYPIQQFVDELDFEEMTLHVYYKLGKETSEFFEDSHDGYEYRQGQFSMRSFKVTGKEDEIIVQQHKSGKYSASYTNFKIKFHGIPFRIKRVFFENEDINPEELQFDVDEQTMIVDKDFSELHIVG